MVKDFRFGVGLHAAKSQSSVQEAARRVEDLGFDVLHLPDHLEAPAPFPTLITAATATTTLRIGAADLSWDWVPAMCARSLRRPNCPSRPHGSASSTWST